MSLYSVLHKNPAYSRQKTVEFLSGELALSKEEAAAVYGRRPGFLLENAALEKASAFNSRAAACGLETVLVDNKDLVHSPSPAPVNKIELRPAGFCYFAATGAEKPAQRKYLPFEALKLLAVRAEVIELPPKELRVLEAGLIERLRNKYFPFRLPPAKTGGDEASAGRAGLEPKETVFAADIIAAGPEVLRLNWIYDDFDYSTLGGEKLYSSLENLRLLLEKISALAFKAGKNPLLAAFLRKESLGPLKHPSPAAYEKELQWLLTINSGT